MVEVGDLIFGHIKGYRPWPARVMGPSNKAGHFSVFFFGTYQTGDLKPREMYQYTTENIAKYGKPGKNQPFNKALKEIEENPKDISENNSYQGNSCQGPNCGLGISYKVYQFTFFPVFVLALHKLFSLFNASIKCSDISQVPAT